MEITKNNISIAFGGAYRGKRVLVTGHTGFKGSWLAEWLLFLGADVTGYALAPATEPALFTQLGLARRLRHIVGDVRDLAALQKAVAETRPEFVFHLAAQPLVRLSYSIPVETYAVNVMGTVNVLEAVRLSGLPCTVVAITTDKCYENREWVHSYREEDPMGGYDPYSSSKGAAELVIASYRRSYFSPSTSDLNVNLPRVLVASARAGNVIGGGDWALDRIVPDCIRALQRGESIPVRNKIATRPWQHVLEPLSGYLWLAACLANAQLSPFFASVSRSENRGQTPAGQQAGTANAQLASAFNFGPALTSNRTVADLVQEILKHWPGEWVDKSDPHAVHEAKLLNLPIDKAHHFLGWQPAWDFSATIKETVEWYRAATGGGSAGGTVESLKGSNPSPLHPFTLLPSAVPQSIHALTLGQINNYTAAAKEAGIAWAQ